MHMFVGLEAGLRTGRLGAELSKDRGWQYLTTSVSGYRYESARRVTWLSHRRFDLFMNCAFQSCGTSAEKG